MGTAVQQLNNRWDPVEAVWFLTAARILSLRPPQPGRRLRETPPRSPPPPPPRASEEPGGALPPTAPRVLTEIAVTLPSDSSLRGKAGDCQRKQTAPEQIPGQTLGS